MKNLLILIILLSTVVLFSGCTEKVGKLGEAFTSSAPNVSAIKSLKKPEFETPFIGSGEALVACVQLCNKQKDLEVNLSTGPCLSNEIQANWVCDVAHNPRIEIDNDIATQCAAFNNGTAKHFVEVDTECNLIRTR
ncbi:TPA: hypothetical protein H1005_03535 [archaeon]|uniref:Lipoprotein n=1 Tax=Candidatus Naiadarchaeum limnaeum TaxID=2756139 RepID=A0A832X5T7_9ARCH|nr:hypothetical protein [Candidatus Naiadarchaeales archaeon SRR2090153.bin1042]HIK00140.1 hypothetical protein [Candidatus Naiadarchaeum limnaeum]